MADMEPNRKTEPIVKTELEESEAEDGEIVDDCENSNEEKQLPSDDDSKDESSVCENSSSKEDADTQHAPRSKCRNCSKKVSKGPVKISKSTPSPQLIAQLKSDDVLYISTSENTEKRSNIKIDCGVLVKLLKYVSDAKNIPKDEENEDDSPVSPGPVTVSRKKYSYNEYKFEYRKSTTERTVTQKSVSSATSAAVNVILLQNSCSR